MKRASDEQLKPHSTVNRTPVRSKPFSDRFGRKAQAFAVKCSELFASGLNSMDIASRLRVTESAVYNAMARLGQ